MRLFVLPGFFSLTLVIVGCGESVTPTTDTGIQFDAGPDTAPDVPGTDNGTPDSGRPDVPRPMPVCGDSMIGPMEQCDDGNTVDGDGCDAGCRWEAYCGDGTTDDMEVCDDNNNRSGDGCRSDCQSDETCGNSIRDVAAGEVCDDGNEVDGDGCSADCLSLEMCGDDMIVAPETCDDGGTALWDGCGPDCMDEITLRLNTLAVGEETVGCDYTGDGNPDNAFASALGASGVGLVNGFIEPAIDDEDVILLTSFLALDDLSGANDPAVTVGWMQGVRNGEELFIDPNSIDASDYPVASFASSITTNMLAGGPEDIELPLGPLPLELRRGRILGRTTAVDGRLDGIEEGILCGAIPVSTLAFIPNPAGMFGGSPMACDGTMDIGGLSDALVAGVPLFGIGPANPDVDLDGDGLEYYEIIAMGAPNCVPVITACIDGDGTRIEGRNCALDPAMADGFSAGLNFTAIAEEVVGVATMTP